MKIERQITVALSQWWEDTKDDHDYLLEDMKCSIRSVSF